MEMPGNNGGANWGTTAIDPATKTFYVICKDAPSLLHLEPKPPKRTVPGPPQNQGEVLYMQYCKSCHQADLRGQPPAIPTMIGIIQRSGAQRIRDAIHNGIPPMPAIPDLSESDADKVVAYLTDPSKATVAPDHAGAHPGSGSGADDRAEGHALLDRIRIHELARRTAGDQSSVVEPDCVRRHHAERSNGRFPLGDVSALVARGITGTGSFWPRGGGVVTAGGLVIVPTKSDSTLHIYDKDTGKQIAALKLPVSPEGIPTVYEVNGREYVAISARPNTDRIGLGDDVPQDSAAGGPAQVATDDKGQGYYVFALPEALTHK